MTNFDMIKNMSVEEMARFLYKVSMDYCSCCTKYENKCKEELNMGCDRGRIDWLNSECEVSE